MHRARMDLLLDLGYSERAILFLVDEVHLGSIDHPTVYCRHKGGCGDILDLYLDIEDGIIQDAKYELTGCAGLQASASGLAEMIRGMRVEDAAAIDVDDIVDFLGGIPTSKYDCAELARDTLRKALRTIPVERDRLEHDAGAAPQER